MDKTELWEFRPKNVIDLQTVFLLTEVVTRPPWHLMRCSASSLSKLHMTPSPQRLYKITKRKPAIKGKPQSTRDLGPLQIWLVLPTDHRDHEQKPLCIHICTTRQTWTVICLEGGGTGMDKPVQGSTDNKCQTRQCIFCPFWKFLLTIPPHRNWSIR